MPKAATATRKRRGPHRPGRDPVATVRLPRNVWAHIDRWRSEHGAKTRSEAIQRLVEQALGSDPEGGASRKFAPKASELTAHRLYPPPHPVPSHPETAHP